MFRTVCSAVIVLLAATLAHAQDKIPLGRFVDVRPVTGLELGGFEDQSPHISGEGLTIHFASNRGTERRFAGKSIFVATRDSTFDSFGTPAPVDEPLNHIDERRDRLISFDFSSDNRTVVFTTTRNERRVTNLAMSTRDDPKDPWGDPIELGDEINSTEDDWGPSLSADGRSLYFSSFRNGDSDVFVATRDSDDGLFGPAQPLEEINTRSEQSNPHISANGLALFFQTNPGLRELSVATRTSTDGPFGPTQSLNDLGLGSEVNLRGDAVEFTPHVSPDWPADQSKLYYAIGFLSKQDGGWHLYEATWRVALQPGDANQDLRFDQMDLVDVLTAGKYLTGEPATWGEGDWDGVPEGHVGAPPNGDGVFDEKDIVAALSANTYLNGPYGAVMARTAPVAVPEPATAVLLGVGLLAFSLAQARRPRYSRLFA